MNEREKKGGNGAADKVSVQEELFEMPLGERLREKRLERSLELDDVAHYLKVESSVVLLIEDGGDPPHNIPDVFYQGFVRNYARYMGVEIKTGEMQKTGTALDGTLLGKRRIATPSINFNLKPVVERIRAGVEELSAQVKDNLPASIMDNPFPPLAALLAVIALSWLLLSGDSAVDEEAKQVAPSVDNSVGADPKVSSQDVPRTDGTVVEEPQETSGRVDAMSLPRGTVTIRYIDRSWTQVKDGMGRVLVKRMLDAGAIQDFEGPLPLEVKLGNAIGVRVKFNGESFDHLNYIDDNNTAQFVLEGSE